MNILKMTGRLCLTAILSSGLASCSQDPTKLAIQPTDAALTIKMMRTSLRSLEGNWLFTNYKNEALAPVLQNRPTLSFQDQTEKVMRVGGRSFINYYGGTFEVDDQKGLLVLTDAVFATRMGGSEADLKAESKYLDRLSKATFFELSGANELRLYIGPKESPSTEVMYFRRQ
ncbi:MAG TPA: META domain-containing protein [Spirosoma sp.]|nr:META domain-containing protein [Spirosoma sp.]